MAFFTRKKKTEESVKPAQAQKQEKQGKKTAAQTVAVAAPTGNTSGLSHVLRNPRITEKGTMHAEQSAYLFDVAPSATKHEIAQAVSVLYNVTPRMVRVVSVPSKRKQNPRTGVHGVKKGGKKAYVYLKKGETITVS